MSKAKTGRQIQAENTRRHIYECASRLFIERGYENVTIEDVAAEANVSVGAFYHHFKSKQEIFALHHQSQDELYQQFYDQVLCAPEHAASPALDKLRLFIPYIIQVSVSHGVEYICAVYPNLLSNSRFGADMVNRPYFQLLLRTVRQGQLEGSLRPELTAESVVNNITILIRGCIWDWCINNGDVRNMAPLQPAIDCFLRGLSV